MARKEIDWEAVEREYRAGQLSMREIGRQCSVDVSAISRKAKLRGWKRDLSDQVRKEVNARLVTDGNADGNSVNTHEAVDVAARRGVEVVRQHRQSIAGLNRTADTIKAQLDAFLETGPATGEDGKPKCPRIFFGKTDGVANLLKALVDTTSKAISLERQAFNLDAPGGDEKGKSGVLALPQPVSSEEWCAVARAQQSELSGGDA